ncbi:uncharacterized protein LOC115704695 [Cannabis sativa]|uniref:uncharacterized protein LOC115704695 n=1 Tax=Cannabis sativa TaxID=3483 RepID=UPI0029CA88DD|nr:uncharacterized protein LOC115704695 [Cannabis sativa]
MALTLLLRSFVPNTIAAVRGLTWPKPIYLSSTATIARRAESRKAPITKGGGQRTNGGGGSSGSGKAAGDTDQNSRNMNNIEGLAPNDDTKKINTSNIINKD